MNAEPARHASLGDMPLWRLIVALDDAERVAGPDSSTARTLARIVRERLRCPLAADEEAAPVRLRIVRPEEANG